MRLICPNCDAEYEVDDAAVPDTGRDVQCSACGHAWFQLPPEIELALEQEEELFGKTDASDPIPDLAGDAPSAAPAAPEMPRRSVDENLMAILREEAEREAAARKAEAAPIETQPDLGLTQSAPTPANAPAAAGGLAAAARRIAQLKGQDPDARPAKPAARRDLLPDIEEINSSLKGSDPGDDDADGEQATGPAHSRGFRSGFALSLVLAVFAAAVYTSAPRISAHIPAAEAAMTAYVGGVDHARLWLDSAMRSATQAVRDLAQDNGTP